MLIKILQNNNEQKHTNKVEDFMNKPNRNYRKRELKISSIETTNDRLTGRAGLALFVAYLHQIQIFPILDRFFGSIRKNRNWKRLIHMGCARIPRWSPAV